MLGLALLVAARTAGAQPAAARETARTLMDEGDRHFQAGDWAGAHAFYAKARALVRVPTTGLAVAEAEEQLGRVVEARDSALEVTRMPVADGEPSVFAQSRQLARELAERVAGRIASISVDVARDASCGPLSLNVDGAPWPEAALGTPLRIDPGRHRVEARATGCADATTDVALGEGARTSVRIALAPPEPGPRNVASGRANLTTTTPNAASEGRPTHEPPRGSLVLLGVGAASAAVGVAAGIASLVSTAQARDACGDTRCTAGHDAYSTATTTAWVANASFAVAILAGGSGALWLLLGGRNASAPPRVGVGVGSVTVALP